MQRQSSQATPQQQPAGLKNVSKRYGGAVVLDNVSLSVNPGECLVLVGHNGAGKTTLMKLLLGLIRPTAGQVSLFGGDPTVAARRGVLGYLPESIVFDAAMTGRELLNFYAGLKGLDGSSCDDLLTRVGVADAADRRLGTWSKGMRQRLGLAQAMLGEPQFLLLDEPASGLDPSSRSMLYEIIAMLRTAGVTVLISSHALNEVETHADRVAILRQGKLLACGTLAELSAQTALPVEIDITCADGAAAATVSRLHAALADAGDAIRVSQSANGQISVVCPPAHKLAVLRAATAEGSAVIDADIRLPGLDEVYAHFMAGDAPAGDNQP